MTNEDMIILLQKIEKEIDVHALNYQGIQFWPLLRTMIYTQNARNKNGVAHSLTTNKKNIFFNVVGSVFEHFIQNKLRRRLKQADLYFLTGSSCTVQYNDTFKDRFFSPLIEWSDSSFHIDQIVSMDNRQQTSLEQSSSIQFTIYKTYLLAYIFKPKTSHVEFIEHLENINKELFTHNTNINIDIRSLLINVHRLSLLEQWFRKILQKVKPKLVAVLCYYNTSSYALVHAANSLGIKTMDMQHGVQGRNHIGYSAFNKLPSKGWSLLPKYFWNWTKEDSDYINSWGDNKHQGFNGGVVWHSYIQKSSDNNEILRVNTNKKPCVLVSFQPLTDNKEFIEQLRNLIQSKLGNDYFWLIRLHPTMLQQIDDFNKIFEFKNCNVNMATNTPLPLLLQETVYHITRYSSVVIESAIYSIPSLVENGKNCFGKELNDFIILYQNDLTNKFTEIVNNSHVIKNKTVVDSKDFWLRFIETL